MYFKTSAIALVLVSTAIAADRPADMPICDYYTTALLKNNTAENQLTLLTLVVNTAVIGNYTQPNVGIAVPGILAPGMFNGAMVNLAPYFNGMLESSNRGGMAGVSVNFLDGGGAEPLKMNKPANDTNSNQHKLLTHLYSFFGSLLGCTMYGKGAFPAYDGISSMYKVHSFMDLNPAQLGYFIDQVAMSAASFGVAKADLEVVGKALNDLFGMRCSAPAAAIKEQGPQLQAICIEDSCPLAKDAVCDSYGKAVMPMNHTTGGMGGNGSMPSGSMTMTTPMGSPTTTGPVTTTKTGGAVKMGVNAAALVGGFAALML